MTVTRHRAVAVAAVMALSVLAACSGSDPATEPSPDDAPAGIEAAPDVPAPQFVLDVRNAIAAVEAELGGPQEFFEVTSNAQFTNVFVAVDDATAAVPYAFLDGELQPAAPRQDGASGETFTAADIEFIDNRILSGVTADLPDSQIDAVSVYGDGFGATYVLAATSGAGGFLDIIVAPNGAVIAVDPV